MPICRNSYLLKETACLKSFNPRILGRIVDKEFSKHTTYRNLEPPFLKLSSSMPVLFAPTVDTTRARIAFGRRALQKLKREIHSKDLITVLQALNSIHDLIHHPERAFEAIKIGLIDRLSDMMLHEKDSVREKICMILRTLAGFEQGRRLIVRRYKILHNLAMLLEDNVEAVRFKATMLTEMIAFSPISANALNCADYLVLTVRLIGGNPKTKNEDTLIYNLATLKMLLQNDFKILALEHNAMINLIQLLDHQNEKIQILTLECIALLCHIPEGRLAAAENNLGFLLCKKLFSPSTQVKIKVVGTLAFATIQSNTRKALCEKCTIDILLEILENFQNSEGQMMAMKVLRNLFEDSKGKSLILRIKRKIQNVNVIHDAEVRRHKAMLLEVIN